MLHQMTPAQHSEARFSRITDRQMDGQHIDDNSLHLVHSMQPKNFAVQTYYSLSTMH